MVAKCCVQYCTNTFFGKNKHPNVSFHAFPSDAKMLKRWLDVLGLGPLSQKQLQFFKICSNHFKDSDIYQAGMLRRLRKSAVPSLMLFRKIGNIDINNKVYDMFDSKDVEMGHEEEVTPPKEAVEEHGRQEEEDLDDFEEIEVNDHDYTMRNFEAICNLEIKLKLLENELDKVKSEFSDYKNLCQNDFILLREDIRRIEQRCRCHSRKFKEL